MGSSDVQQSSGRAAGFRCNLCGLRNDGPVLVSREEAACKGCGSSIRFRSTMLALSRQLFGHDIALIDFPVLKSLRGLGFSDSETYRELLERKFTYTNTHFDREPCFDLLHPPPGEF